MSYAQVEHDQAGDVLYAKLAEHGPIFSSQPVAGDDFVILNKDRQGRVVGLQLLDVHEMTVARWREHFRTDVPEILFVVVEKWLRERVAQAADRFLFNSSCRGCRTPIS